MIGIASHTGKTEIDRRQESVKNVQRALVNRRSQWAIYIHCTVICVDSCDYTAFKR